MPTNSCAPKEKKPTWLLMLSTYAHTNLHSWVHQPPANCVGMKLSPVAPALWYCQAQEDEEKIK